MTDGFLSHLSQLKENYQSQQENLDAIVSSSEKELEQISSAFRELENQRLEANQRIYQTRQVINRFKIEQQEEMLDLIFTEFNAFQHFMATYLEQNLEVREELQRQLEGLLIQDPMLEQALTEYHAFHTKAEIAFQSIPPFYRKTFEQAIQKQTLRLKPCLDLEEKLKILPDRSDITVPIVLSVDKVHSQMFLAIPAAHPTENQDGRFSQRMDGLENAFLQFLSLLAKDLDWTLLEIERDSWAGFRSLTTLIEYTGQIPFRDAIQEYLDQRFIETWPFKNLTPNPQIAELDWETWKIGQSRSGAILDLIAVNPETETVVSPVEKAQQPVETVSRLFSEKDITAWERPLRVVEDSSWTVPARRLRTLMMRFAAQGRIGKEGLSPEQVLNGLSKEHVTSFEKLFPFLIESGVFHQEEGNGKSFYSLNPDHLADVQDLINRDITPFWAPIVA